MTLLRGVPRLSCLGLASLRLGTANSSDILHTIQESCPRLTLLDVSNNGIAAAGGAAIGSMLQVRGIHANLHLVLPFLHHT